MRLATLVNYSKYIDFYVYAVYDQGSKTIKIPNGDYNAVSTDPPFNLAQVIEEYLRQAEIIIFNRDLVAYYFPYFLILGSLVTSFYLDRRTLKIFRTRIKKNTMVIRRALLNNPRFEGKFSEYWYTLSDKQKQRAIKDVNDYLIVDDF